MSVSPALAIEAVIKSPRDSHKYGVAARYIDVSKTHGFKFYRDRTVAEKTNEIQRQVHAIGYAPEVGEVHEFKMGELQYFGYLTESIVETVYDHNQGLSTLSYEAANRMRQNAQDEAYGIRDIIYNQTGISLTDLHDENCGFMPDGRFVLIDFSHTN